MEAETLVETGTPSELIPTEENAIVLRPSGVVPVLGGNLIEPLSLGSPVSLGMARDSDSERMNAHGLLECLYAEYVEEDAEQRSLLNRWPQEPRSGSTSDSERYIPEVLLRDNDEDSFCFLKTFVRRSVAKLRGDGEDEQYLYDGQQEVVEALGKLSDEGVIEALPALVQRLKWRKLLVMNLILSGDDTIVKNRGYLENRIKKLVSEVHSGQPGQRGQPLTKSLNEIVALLRCGDSYAKVIPRKLELEGSTPVEVAESALTLVDQFPLKHMLVMLATIKNRPAGQVGSLRNSGSKDRVTNSILKVAFDLLAEHGGRKLPEDLRKCLVVMSLSARHTFGSDGQLIDFLRPISIEKRALHRNILSALSDLNYLKTENLRLLYQEVFPHSAYSSRKQPKTMRYQIKTLFLDCLLKSEIRPFPEYVITAAENLKDMMRQQSSIDTKRKRRSEKYLKKDLKRRTELELEAVLRVSSHLQQIILDLSEFSEESVSHAHESDFSMVMCRRNEENTRPLETRQLRGRLRDGAFQPVSEAGVVPSESQEAVATADCRLDDGMGPDKNKQIQIWSLNHTPDSPNRKDTEEKTELRENCQREAVSLAETKLLPNVTRLGDEVARVAYTLVGCALEEISHVTGLMLESPVKSYLKSGLKRRLCKTVPDDEKDLDEQDQVDLILSLAQKDSRISSRTMDRVKRRLQQR